MWVRSLPKTRTSTSESIVSFLRDFKVFIIKKHLNMYLKVIVRGDPKWSYIPKMFFFPINVAQYLLSLLVSYSYKVATQLLNQLLFLKN